MRDLNSRLELLLELTSAAASGCGVPVGYTVVETGDFAWDDCCDDGYAYIKVDRIQPTMNFPQPTLVPANCRHELSVQVELGILRCYPNFDSTGETGPSPETRTAHSLAVNRDAAIIYNVLTAHNPDWSNYPITIDTWRPAGPQGGCGGGAWFFYLDACLPTCGGS